MVYGLALYRSLARQAGGPFTLYVLCLDTIVFEHLQTLSLPNIRLVPLTELERALPQLPTVRGSRTLVEYYFTCTPLLPRYLFERYPNIESLAYVDADVYFYSRLLPIYEEFGRGSVLVVPHRLPVGRRVQDYGGPYNVGLVLFRNDQSGRDCLAWWSERCLEWCYMQQEDGKYADQGYLTDWPTRFRGVVVSEHKGVGLGPWNVAQYALNRRDGAVCVDTSPLIFYHFGELRIVRPWLFTHDLLYYDVQLNRPLKEYIYRPYLQELRSVVRDYGVKLARRMDEKLSLPAKIQLQLYRRHLLVLDSRIVQIHYGSIGPLLTKVWSAARGFRERHAWWHWTS